jgi:branched-chain amino acid transport system permease protein
MNPVRFYYFTLFVSTLCLLLIYIILRSPFGLSVRGIRDNEERMRSLGFNVWNHKYLIFVLAGVFAGVAGWLSRDYTGIMVPGYLGVMTSTTAMLMVIIGGENVFWGPILGAFLITLVEYYASIYTPARWPLILGAIFVISVLYLRDGVAGGAQSLAQRWRGSRASASD